MVFFLVKYQFMVRLTSFAHHESLMKDILPSERRNTMDVNTWIQNYIGRRSQRDETQGRESLEIQITRNLRARSL